MTKTTAILAFLGLGGLAAVLAARSRRNKVVAAPRDVRRIIERAEASVLPPAGSGLRVAIPTRRTPTPWVPAAETEAPTTTPAVSEADIVVETPTILDLDDVVVPPIVPDYDPAAAAAPTTTDDGILPGHLYAMGGRNNWRSGAIPSYDALANMVRVHGIKRVVNLALDSMKGQSADENFTCAYSTAKSKRDQLCEPQWAAALGLDYYDPVMTSHGLRDNQWPWVRLYLDKGDTLIHCTHGADRTGAVAGRYRMEREGWDANDTLAEALKYGFKPVDHPGWGKGPDPNKNLREWMLTGVRT